MLTSEQHNRLVFFKKNLWINHNFKTLSKQEAIAARGALAAAKAALEAADDETAQARHEADQVSRSVGVVSL